MNKEYADSDQNKNTTPELGKNEEARRMAIEKGFAEGGAHRSDQTGDVGPAESEEDKDWIQQQTGSVVQPQPQTGAPDIEKGAED